VRRAVLALALLGLLAGPHTVARADPGATGGFCDLEPGLCAGIQSLGAPDEDRAPHPGPHRWAPSRFYWRSVELNGSQWCTGPDGRQLFLRLIDRATNQVIDERFRCPDPTVRGSEDLPPVPPPPTAVWEQVPLPMPEVKVNPGVAGLTGLETYFWYDQPTTANLQLNLDGFTVTVDARVIRLRWRTGDGTELTSTVPGTPSRPAAQHVYEAKGSYTVTLDVTWSGTYSFAGPEFDPITVPLGERTFSGQAPYAVGEIRGVRQ
jgi:PKD domain-containing protein